MVSQRAAIVAGRARRGASTHRSPRCSGHLSPARPGPAARRDRSAAGLPLGHPPPDLAATNEPPSSGVFQIALGPDGSEAQAVVTSDNQVTVILPLGAFAPKAGQTEVTFTVDPVDPATLEPPGSGVTVFGNAYLLQATYRPRGTRAEARPSARHGPDLSGDAQPPCRSASALHVAGRADVDGAGGSDSLAQQQAEGPVSALGYVMVAGEAGAVARHALRRLQRVLGHRDRADGDRGLCGTGRARG